MAKQSPLISIITVTFNAAEALAMTMSSVAGQTCQDYEHIIVDGASKDDTLQTIERLKTTRTRANSEPDKGIYDAMNKGLGFAQGKYVLFLNAGDKLHDNETLAVYKRAIESNNKPGVVYGQTIIVDKAGKYLGNRHHTAPEKLTLQSFASGMIVCHQAFLALRRIVPLYDTRWRFSADYEWCIRILQHSRKNVYTGTITADYLSEGATTSNRWASLKERFRIMCHYYGTVPTVLRHIWFVPRAVFRRLSPKKQQSLK